MSLKCPKCHKVPQIFCDNDCGTATCCGIDFYMCQTVPGPVIIKEHYPYCGMDYDVEDVPFDRPDDYDE